MRHREVEGFGRQNVKEGGRRGECLDPVGGRHGGLKQQGANNIIDGADNALSFTILRRGVGAGHAEMDALSEEKGPSAGIVELLAIVALNGLHRGTKLSGDVGDEVGKRAVSVRLEA